MQSPATDLTDCMPSAHAQHTAKEISHPTRRDAQARRPASRLITAFAGHQRLVHLCENLSINCSVIVFVTSDGSFRRRFSNRPEARLSLKIRERWMIRTMVLGAALAFGFATTSSAAITPVPVG